MDKLPVRVQDIVTEVKDEKERNRVRNLRAIMDGYFPVDKGFITALCLKQIPDLIHAEFNNPIRNIIRAYDRVILAVQEGGIQQITAEEFTQLALEFSAYNTSYNFITENEVLQQCRRLMLYHGRNNRPTFIYIYRAINGYKYNNEIKMAALILALKEWLIMMPELISSDLSAVIREIRHSFNHPQEIQEKLRLLLPLPPDKETATTNRDHVFMWLRLLVKEQACSLKTIMEKVGEKSRKTFVEVYLTPALDKNLIERTESKIKSSKQKYRLTESGRQYVLARETKS